MPITKNYLGIPKTMENDGDNIGVVSKARATRVSAGATPQPSTTRWNPTSEQLMILEDMYRGGIRTPNADQIQQITAHLSLYGKIEGKNVFYWFQNHKARDRQKMRRKNMDNNKQEMSGTLQDQVSPADEVKKEWKLDINSTEECCKSISSCGSMEHDWAEVDTASDMTSRIRPLTTLELFPLCSGL
eukprot:Gb_01484 [translate_table: standard]